MEAYFTGLIAGMALIMAIGAQNAFVLRQGIRRSHVVVVVTLCALSDIALIAVGTLGVGTLIEHAPWALDLLRWGGAAYLVWFAIGSFRSAARDQRLIGETAGTSAAVSRRTVVLTTLSLTFLNPHVYLDTVVMLGNLANQHEPVRWVFAAGAMTASIVWFTALGAGAHALAKPLNHPTTWRVVDLGVGIVMLLIAARLLLSG